MTIDVLLSGEAVPIDEAVFKLLLDNSVAGTYVDYERALESRSIKFSDLERLARRGDIPLPLFFAPLPLVEAQVAAKTRKLLAGVSRDTFQIGTRSQVDLRDVELIVRDLIRKQELLKKHDDSLTKNKIVGLLRKPGASAEADAANLMAAVGLTHEAVRTCKKKESALELLIGRLEANQVLVARSVQHYMPQRLTHVTFSGMTVRDSKIPVVFLAGGEHGDNQEPVGRTVFTLALMAVLVARRIFKPVTWDGQSIDTDLGREYDTAAAMLMPADRMRALSPVTPDDMKSVADEFKVTPSAAIVRAMRLGQINGATAHGHLEQLRQEYAQRPKDKGMSAIKPENAVRKYAGRELSRRMLDVMDSGAISAKEFCRTVCLNKLQPSQIGDLRRAVE